MQFLILTDPTVWTSEAWGALAAVPVIPVDAGSTVVAAEKEVIEMSVCTSAYPQAIYRLIYHLFFYINTSWMGISRVSKP